MIDLYTYQAPCGYKASICLEELQMPYTVKVVKIWEGEQHKEEFLQLNPNAKIPVIVDRETDEVIFESCAILLYLADKAGALIPPSGKQRREVIQWLFFQAASIGPMLGQRMHFAFVAPEKIPYAIARYTKETDRLYNILEQRLIEKEFICDRYSIADIAHFGWLYMANQRLDNLEHFPHLTAWYDRMAARPAVAKGVTVPAPSPFA